MSKVKINRNANSITFTNNNISFSQFGIAKEILDLIENQQQEIEQLNKENKILRENAEHNDKVVDKVNWENKRLNNIINDIDTYIHLWKLDDIGEKTMLILNDILLIKNGMSNEVIRLKGDE